MKLCRLDDIDEGQARGFRVPGGHLIAVKQEGRVYLYHNQCPHMGVNLDWQQDRFFNYDHSYLQCSMHGALFEIDSGHCIAGPCRGQALEAIDYQLIDGEIVLDSAGLCF